MSIVVPEQCGGNLDLDRGAIRMSASASLVQSVAQRLNWMLGYHGAGLVFSGAWNAPQATWDGDCYHRRGVNTDQVLLVAVIEGSSGAGKAEFDFTPDSGSTVSYDTDEPSGGPIFTGDWILWAQAVDITAAPGLLQHSWQATYSYLHALTIWDCPRIEMDPTAETAIGRRAGAWAGLETGRRITDSDVAGIAALLQGTRDARDKTVRHLQWCDAEADALSHTISAANTWETVAGFELRHRARQLHSLTSEVAYTAALKGKRASGTGTCDLRFVSSGGLDVAAALGLGTSWAWHSCTTGLDIDADTTDTITLKARSTISSDVIECCGGSLVE